MRLRLRKSRSTSSSISRNLHKLRTDLLIGQRAQAFIVQDQIQLLFSATHVTLSLDFFPLLEGSLIQIYHRLLIFSIAELKRNSTPLPQEKRSLNANHFTLPTNHFHRSTTAVISGVWTNTRPPFFKSGRGGFDLVDIFRSSLHPRS